MTEKVIHEMRFIETDDGFRIEVKGDKEKLREMGFGPGMMGFFGPRMWRKRHKRHGGHHHEHHEHRHRGHGRFHRKRHAHRGFGPWAWHHEEADAEEAAAKEPKTA